MGSPTKSLNFQFCNDLELWMTKLPQSIKNLPLIQLAIPGSHDSMTSTITSYSPIAPDSEEFLQRLKCLGPLLGFTVSKWAKTQEHSATSQLKNGIRYFDLRISTRVASDDLYFVHGMYAEEVSTILNELDVFLQTHLGEVIILDFQHFYDFNSTDHDKLMSIIYKVFSNKLLPYNNHMDHITLNYLTLKYKYQVIAIYRSNASRFGHPLLWPAASFPTPWPNTVSTRDLIDKLNDNLDKRNPSFGFISQFVLTPTTWFVLKNLGRSLKTTCALPIEKQKIQWLIKQSPGRGGINIVISDFVDLSVCQFAKEVISLNLKLLSENVSPDNDSFHHADTGI